VIAQSKIIETSQIEIVISTIEGHRTNRQSIHDVAMLCGVRSVDAVESMVDVLRLPDSRSSICDD